MSEESKQVIMTKVDSLNYIQEISKVYRTVTVYFMSLKDMRAFLNTISSKVNSKDVRVYKSLDAITLIIEEGKVEVVFLEIDKRGHDYSEI